MLGDMIEAFLEAREALQRATAGRRAFRADERKHIEALKAAIDWQRDRLNAYPGRAQPPDASPTARLARKQGSVTVTVTGPSVTKSDP